MKAYLFSIGERTTDISKWALEHLGFKTTLLYDPKTTLQEKYEQFLEMAKDEKWVIRCDADIIVLPKFKTLLEECFKSDPNEEVWWWNFMGFDFIFYGMGHSGPKVMNHKVLEVGQKYKKNFFRQALKPETAFWNRDEFKNPRRCQTVEGVSSIHGYKQRPEDYERVNEMKKKRGHYKNYDHELINKLNNL